MCEKVLLQLVDATQVKFDLLTGLDFTLYRFWGGGGGGLTDPHVRSFPRQIANILKITPIKLGSHLLLCTVHCRNSGLEISCLKIF
jgi:hypothetical protein